MYFFYSCKVISYSIFLKISALRLVCLNHMEIVLLFRCNSSIYTRDELANGVRPHHLSTLGDELANGARPHHLSTLETSTLAITTPMRLNIQLIWSLIYWEWESNSEFESRSGEMYSIQPILGSIEFWWQRSQIISFHNKRCIFFILVK
jgi:hypothetical protein